jgi:DNA-binding CsgD family transcriptional regulator
MAKLTDDDYLSLLHLVYLANSCQNIDSFTTRCLPAVARAFSSEIATFHLIDGPPQNLTITESKGCTSDCRNAYDRYYPDLYKDYFYQRSPLLKAALTSRETALKIVANISLKEWERTDFFNNFILPQHLYWEMFVGLRWHNKLEGMITLWRTRKECDYDENDLAKAEIIAPHFMLTIRHMANLKTDPGPAIPCEGREADFKTGFHLSERELDILRYVISGMSYSEIGDALFISRLTVHTHVKNIYRKIGIRNKVELGRFLELMANNIG